MNAQFQEQFSKTISKINEKNPYYIVIGFLLVIVFIPSICVMSLQIRNLMSLGSNITNISLELEAIKNDVLRTPQYQKEIAILTGKLERSRKKIKSREEFPVILENITRIANKYGVVIEQIMPDSSMDDPVLENDDGKYYSIPIIVEAASGFHPFGRFINYLERESLFTNISEFTIAGSESSSQQRINFIVNTIILESAAK